MNHKIDMRKFLNTCVAIEKSIASIYRQFAATIPEDEELQAIWIKLAKEEDQHAMDISFAARLPHEGVYQVKNLTQSRVDQLLTITKDVLNKAKLTNLSAQAAANITLKLEQEFLDVHIAASVEFETASMQKMFQSISKNEEEHCREIKAYCDKIKQ
ncbi:Rubrerythrin [Desulfuromusa kysingii]|uniref:Rubrerythrin n=1 Tax=Desulfuromusa kysingii TaxID=37625 RepID=A0A1H3XAY6_9BACT|nr:hypothetical protein [Desulfuromusa kysingii]SDZ96390.1 Rubrerythrin [Desulfuromusa kysingii]